MRLLLTLIGPLRDTRVVPAGWIPRQSLAESNARRHAPRMRLEGWNHIPEGYSATFDVASAPLWLRAWFRTPFVDRVAYPVIVRRGFGYLRRDDLGHENPAPVSGGWKLREPGYIAPGSYAAYRPVDETDR